MLLVRGQQQHQLFVAAAKSHREESVLYVSILDTTSPITTSRNEESLLRLEDCSWTMYDHRDGPVLLCFHHHRVHRTATAAAGVAPLLLPNDQPAASHDSHDDQEPRSNNYMPGEPGNRRLND
jgi:hypothetical protein